MALEQEDELLLDLGPPLGLDDLQLDCQLPPGLGLEGLGGLGDLGVGAAAGPPASSDLLESLQLDAFSQPLSSTGAGGQPGGSGSGSGSDSPVVLPMVGAQPVPPAVVPFLPAAAAGTAPQAPAGQQLRSSRNAVGDGASPATSESEARQRGRSGSPAGTGAGDSRAPAGAGGSGGAGGAAGRFASEEEKRLARMQRNRENAQLSRQRKKAQMEELAARCATLTQHNAQLAGAVRRLTAENAQLRQQLALVCQATKGAAAVTPQPGAAAKPAAAGAKPAAPAAAAAKPAAAGAAAKPAAPTARPAAAAAGVPAIKPATATDAAVVAAAARGMQWPLLPFGFLPRVGLPGMQRPAAAAQPAAAAAAAVQQQQQQQQQRAAAAKPAAPAKAAAPEQPQPQRASKRARTASGASTAFLALLSVFMIAGLGGPMVPTRSGEPAAPLAVAGSRRALQALPDPAALHNHGRSLAALPAGSSAASERLAETAAAAAAVEPQPPPLEMAPPGSSAAGPGGLHLQQLLNSTLQALLLEPGNAELEAAALARLQELGPVALLLDADDARGGGRANPLAASAAFPQLAGQLFGAAGLEGPQVCRPVLEFDAASVPHAMRSRRSLERFILGATGFRGRSLAAGPAAPGAAGAADSGAPALPGGATRGAPAVQPAHAAPLRIGEDDDDQAAAAGVDGTSADGGQALLPAGGAGGPVLVSVLLPANASEGAGGEPGGSGAKLAASDKVFVVLLHPRQRYVAYSCALPRPVVL